MSLLEYGLILFISFLWDFIKCNNYSFDYNYIFQLYTK